MQEFGSLLPAVRPPLAAITARIWEARWQSEEEIDNSSGFRCDPMRCDGSMSMASGASTMLLWTQKLGAWKH